MGFNAGLLGIGGGAIMVPVLTSLFFAMGLPFDQVVHLALGTSMASIMITSFASMRAYHQKKAVLWTIVKAMLPGVFLGTFFAAYLVHLVNPFLITLFFALFMLLVALQMFFIHPTHAPGKLPRSKELGVAGFTIGGLSTLVAIGGGSITVPYLTLRHVEPIKAIGTSAALGFPISFFATMGFIIHGFDISQLSQGLFGSIYLPAFFLITISSYFLAPVGVRFAHKLPTYILKRCFAILALFLSGWMFYDVYSHW